MQPSLVVAVERIGNDLTGEKISLHYARDLCRVPVLNFRMIGSVERAEFPSRVKFLPDGFRSLRGNAKAEEQEFQSAPAEYGQFMEQAMPPAWRPWNGRLEA